MWLLDKAKKLPCNICWKETVMWTIIANKWSCMDCINKKSDIIKSEIIKQEIKKPDVISLPMYTASYLNNKLNKDYKSIINERCCVKVWDKYILHEDIITNFILWLQQ